MVSWKLLRESTDTWRNSDLWCWGVQRHENGTRA
jgi:hypothetical protein